ncbi:MAG: hypothetical protein M3O46_21400 [Myxococcota bacterium]|nr:hypothetical protein [Myxococcota bacterium]
MRTLVTCTAVATIFVVLVACAKKQDDTQPPATAPTAAGYPPQGYPPPQPTYGQQQQPYPNQYPAPTAAYAQPGAQPTAAPPAPVAAPTGTPAAPGQMAVPGPIAFQCQNDVPCGTHHCNVQYGKCAFPCQSAADCITPNQCMAGLCVPAPPH